MVFGSRDFHEMQNFEDILGFVDDALHDASMLLSLEGLVVIPATAYQVSRFAPAGNSRVGGRDARRTAGETPALHFGNYQLL